MRLMYFIFYVLLLPSLKIYSSTTIKQTSKEERLCMFYVSSFHAHFNISSVANYNY